MYIYKGSHNIKITKKTNKFSNIKKKKGLRLITKYSSKK